VAAVSDLAIRGDLGDNGVLGNALDALVAKGLPGESRAVIHLAGSGDVETARRDPITVFKENVIRTSELLEGCRRVNVRRFLYPSSGLVYGRRGQGLFTEESVPRPDSLYAATKLAVEALVQGYAVDYEFSCDIVRLSNIYGPESPENTVVGTILWQIREGKNVRPRSLSAVRDFIYVGDAVIGFIRLLQAGAETGYRLINLSTGVGTSIGELVRTALMVAGRDVVDQNGPPQPAEDIVILSNQRLAVRTGWKPSRSLIEGLRESIH
jgi:UDP-glucose 4-epimerase